MTGDRRLRPRSRRGGRFSDLNNLEVADQVSIVLKTKQLDR